MQEVLGVTQATVDKLLRQGGYTVDERVPEAGYVYFPVGYCHVPPDGCGNRGRVLWSVVTETDQLDLSADWGFPTERQLEQIQVLLAHYVLLKRQVRASA